MQGSVLVSRIKLPQTLHITPTEDTIVTYCDLTPLSQGTGHGREPLLPLVQSKY